LAPNKKANTGPYFISKKRANLPGNWGEVRARARPAGPKRDLPPCDNRTEVASVLTKAQAIARECQLERAESTLGDFLETLTGLDNLNRKAGIPSWVISIFRLGSLRLDAFGE
jgi:hypothetical protein